MAPLATTTPIVIGELGDTDCTTNFSPALMTWADAHGVSYTPWAWNVASCASDPSLIAAYTGTPTAYGVGVQTHLLLVSSTTSPPPVIPEVPLAVLLPLTAVILFGGALWLGKRRRSSAGRSP
jgi:hypothetical protein